MSIAHGGVICPLITPFAADGSIDTQAWGAHIDRVVEAGLDGVLVFGSIGEFFALPAEVKEAGIDVVVRRVNGRAAVLAGITGSSVEDTLALGKAAMRAGADGLVVIAPYYFALSEPALEAFFDEVAGALDAPIVLYNFPDRTGSDLSPGVVAKLAQRHRNIVGIKDTTDSASHARSVIHAVRDVRQLGSDFAVLSGFDEYYTPNRIAGGQGVLSGLTNVIPEVFALMHRSYEAGELATAHAAAAIISDAMALYGQADLFVSAIKFAAGYAARSDISTELRRPFVELNDAQRAQIRGLVDAAQAEYARLKNHATTPTPNNTTTQE